MDVEARKIALKLLDFALNRADPYKAVMRSVKFIDGKIDVLGKVFDVEGKIYVLGFGKASCLMAKAIEDLIFDRIEDGLIITKYGYSKPLKKVRIFEAGHPIPDERSLEGTLEGVEIAKEVDEKDILIVLVSGGGSSLFTLPENGISLEDKIKTNELLLKSGAKIQDVNAVRKHISKVKGGKLAKIVKGTLISLIISDIVGDRLDTIASGPTVKDNTTFEDAYRILNVYGLWEKIPESIRDHIELGMKGRREETLKEDLKNVYNFLILSNRMICEDLVRKSRFRSYILTTTLEGEAREVAIALGSLIEEVYNFDRPFKKPCILIAGGETTVTIERGSGMGGPNQEFALSISRKISGLRGVAVLSVDTDGTDGPTDSAGGLVDSYTFESLKRRGIDVNEYLRNHNSYEALKNADALVITGPTGTNVNSLVIAVIIPSSFS